MDVSLIFGIIFTLVLIGFILVFGWDQILNILGVGEEAKIVRAMDNLEKKVSDIYGLAEGSSERFSLSFSGSYRLCFFNSSNPASRFYSERSRTWDPDSSVKYRINASHYNVWYYSGEDDAAGDGRRIPYLDMPTEGNFCAPGGSRIYVTKKFDWVEVEPA